MLEATQSRCSGLESEFTQAVLSSSRLYGDESELHFWTVAAHYLHSLSQAKSGDTVVTKEGAPKDRLNNPLDICYDVLCENAYFQVLLLLEKELSQIRPLF